MTAAEASCCGKSSSFKPFRVYNMTLDMPRMQRPQSYPRRSFALCPNLGGPAVSSAGTCCADSLSGFAVTETARDLFTCQLYLPEAMTVAGLVQLDKLLR